LHFACKIKTTNSANLVTAALSLRCGNGRITLSSGGYISGNATDYVIYTW